VDNKTFGWDRSGAMENITTDGVVVSFLGDIFVCPATAISYVSSHGSGEVYKETTLYVIHGLLHLLGYDDIEDKDIVEMREAEAQLLSLIDENDLWLQA
jgi:probable rRNA maturation factor